MTKGWVDAVRSYVEGNDGAGMLEPRQITSGSVDQHNIRVRGSTTPQRQVFCRIFHGLPRVRGGRQAGRQARRGEAVR